MKRHPFDLSRRLARKRRQRILKFACLAGLGVMAFSLLFNLTVRLPLHRSQPPGAILVLGGSIHREIYAAQLASRYPQLPILISQGSDAPCIRSVFQEQEARLTRVWLEKCADSTFGNFFFSVPILRRWGVSKVKLVTSASHLPRAQWLGQILLGAQGIAVEVDLAEERGRPGNEESPLKTALDVTRSLIWAFFSQAIQPPCWETMALSEVEGSPGARCERH